MGDGDDAEIDTPSMIWCVRMMAHGRSLTSLLQCPVVLVGPEIGIGYNETGMGLMRERHAGRLAEIEIVEIGELGWHFRGGKSLQGVVVEVFHAAGNTAANEGFEGGAHRAGDHHQERPQ
jgi:hypothetical protein